VANPANVLAKMIASLTDDNGHITIPGFYDDVLEVSLEERAEMAKAPFNLEQYKKAIDVAEVHGEKGYSTSERTGIRPTLDVNGMWSGYIGEGAKTVLPSVAQAKISMRLVPHQDHHKIAALFSKHFKAIAPSWVKVEVKDLHGGQGYVSPTDMIAYRAADKAYTDTFGKKPVPVRSGGSIPIISTFEQVLGTKSILMGFGLESDAIHSPNENFPLFNFDKGIETIVHFYHHFAEMSK
jgi:acetylornithine deacetylase/succinyl-diaminopimelate desuccinylase-like protein